ncbi:MAG: hypothetical protein LUH10_11830 [Tannerellaceae bacterium]|nr:hypothetical protein [Tannerellaceae bacterium]
MRKQILLLICVLGAFCTQAQRFDRGIEQHTFVPKGQWVVGSSISYSEYSSDNYKFLVIEGIDASGYSFKVSPLVCYFFRDNVGAGGRFSYNRTLTKLDALSLNLGDDLDLDINDFYNLSHSGSATAIVRTYISLGNSKRFGLFNEAQLTGGYGQGKLVNGKGDDLTGTFQKKIDLQIGMAPGLVAFINNYTAIEVSIGVLGFNYSKTKQLTDQVYEGERSSSSANFKINLFSIGLGIAFYL